MYAIVILMNNLYSPIPKKITYNLPTKTVGAKDVTSERNNIVNTA